MIVCRYISGEMCIEDGFKCPFKSRGSCGDWDIASRKCKDFAIEPKKEGALFAIIDNSHLYKRVDSPYYGGNDMTYEPVKQLSFQISDWCDDFTFDILIKHLKNTTIEVRDKC